MLNAREEALQAAIVGLSRVADALVAVPPDAQARAFRAVEESYRQSAHDLGYDDDEAKSWADAMIFRLRNEAQARSAEVRNPDKRTVTVSLKSLSAA